MASQTPAVVMDKYDPLVSLSLSTKCGNANFGSFAVARGFLSWVNIRTLDLLDRLD